MRFEAMPVAPGGDGWLGHNAAFRRDRLGMLNRLVDEREPLERLRMPVPGVRAMIVLGPELVQEVLVEKAKHFEKSDMLRFSLERLAGEGLFTSTGELWKRQRKLLAPLFTPKALEAYASDMIACAHRTADGWRDGDELELARETTRLTMGVAGKTLFDADTFSEADELGRALTTALGWTGRALGRPLAIAHVVAKRALLRAATRARGEVAAMLEAGARRLTGPLVLWGEDDRGLASAVAFLDVYVQRLIDERRRAPGDRTDLLARLLDARDEDGARMSDRQVRDEVLTLFIAGHETTATGLAWTIYLACKHPPVLEALHREADRVGDALTAADLPALDLSLRAFKEALRLYPPLYVFSRDSKEPVTIGGYDLPAPMNVLISPWVLHRSPRLWEDPERYDPGRFTAEREHERPRCHYLPFGAGPRVCLGNHFAYMEAQLALAVLLRRFTFELLGDDEPDPGATLRPKRGVRVRVRARDRRVV